MNGGLKATAVWTDAEGGSLFVAITGRRDPARADIAQP